MGYRKIYETLPVFLQNAACNAASTMHMLTKYNKDFFKCLESFNKRESWSHERIIEFRNKRLADIVLHAYNTVPYYHDTFDRLDITPADIKTEADLKQLPVLTKQIINSQGRSRFISSEAGKYKCRNAHTSGTTSGTAGAGFTVTTTIDNIHAEWAAFWRYYNRLGIQFGDRQITLASERVVPASQSKPPFWREMRPENRTYFSSCHMTEDNLKYYCERIAKIEPSWINGYPSLMTVLADYMNRNGISFPSIKHVTCGAENLAEYQIATMTKAFGVRPYQCYGLTETVACFTQHPDGRLMVDEDFSVVEFLPSGDDGCRIIGTNLWNYAMPLLRWDTGDMAVVSEKAGEAREIISINGRDGDCLLMPDGQRVSCLAGALRDACHIREAQIYQHKDYSVELLLAADPDEAADEAAAARSWLLEVTHGQVPISITYVDSIPRSGSIKLRFIISELSCRK